MRTDRGHSLDFVESAKRDAARSKEILATVLADLNEHNRWFEAYRSEEKKKRERHARLLRRHHVTLVRQERHELRVEAVKGSSRKVAARTRASIMSQWDGLVGEAVAIKDAFWSSADWTRRSLTHLGSGAQRLSSTALSGIGDKSGSFGKVTAAAVSAASERFAKAASAGAAWTATRGRAVAGASASALSAASSRLSERKQAMSSAAGRVMPRPSEDGESVSLPAAAGSSALSLGLARTRQALASASEKAAAGLARSGAAARSLASAGTKSLSGSTKWGGETAKRLGAAISTGSAGSLAFLRERGKAAGSGLATATSGVRSKARELSGSVAPRLAAAKAAASAAAQTSAKKASEGLAGASSRIGKATEGARAKLKTTAPALHKKYDDAMQGVRSAVATQWTAAKPMVEEWRHKASDLVGPEQREKLRAAAAETIARRTAGTKAEAIGAKLLDQLKRVGAAPAGASETAPNALHKEPIGAAAGPAGRNTAIVVYQPDIAKLLSDLSERERNRG